jgi:hypothetical protein
MLYRNFLHKKFFLIGISVLVLLVVSFAAVNVYAQDKSVDDLTYRLQQRGVSVKKIGITSRVPFSLDISIQGSSSDKNSSSDDVWAELLTEHEARLAYRIGLQVDSFTLRLLNKNGEEISTNQYYLHEENRIAASPTIAGQLNDAQAKQKVISGLNLGEIQLASLAVVSDQALGNNGQILTITGTVSDLEAANRSVGPFIDSFRNLMWGYNKDKTMAITLCRVRVNDKSGNMVLDYMIDTETGTELFGVTPGLTDNFYPHPAPTGASIITPIFSPTPIPQLTPMLSTVLPPNNPVGYPPPGSTATPTATNHPYP